MSVLRNCRKIGSQLLLQVAGHLEFRAGNIALAHFYQQVGQVFVREG